LIETTTLALEDSCEIKMWFLALYLKKKKKKEKEKEKKGLVGTNTSKQWDSYEIKI
jgi:hypothetical protein